MKPHILFFLIPLLLLFVSCSDETNPSGFDKVDSLEEVKSAETVLENANTNDSCSLTARDVIEAARDYRSSVNRVRVTITTKQNYDSHKRINLRKGFLVIC